MDPVVPPVAVLEPDENTKPSASSSGATGIEDTRSDADWDRRVLCPDGGCVGIVGEDGRCSACGRSAAVADLPSAAGRSAVSAPKGLAAVEECCAQHDDMWSQRRLCSDGACIGIVGDNGLCRVCGKAP